MEDGHEDPHVERPVLKYVVRSPKIIKSKHFMDLCHTVTIRQFRSTSDSACSASASSGRWDRSLNTWHFPRASCLVRGLRFKLGILNVLHHRLKKKNNKTCLLHGFLCNWLLISAFHVSDSNYETSNHLLCLPTCHEHIIQPKLTALVDPPQIYVREARRYIR